MRALLWFASTLLLLSAPVHALVLFDDWVVSGNAFVIDGSDHTAAYLAPRSVAVIEGPIGRSVLAQGDCKEIDPYRFCFLELDTQERVQYRAGQEYPALKVRVERLSPEVRISQSISSSEVELGKRAEVTVTLENSGDKPALNVQYTQRLPEGIAVVSSSGGQRSVNLVQWDGVLSAKKSVTFKYTIEARSFAEAALIATLTYFDGEAQQRIAADPLEFSVTLPFTIEQKFSPEDFGLSQEVVYKVQIANSMHRPFDVDAFTITVPSGMVVSRASNNWKPNGARRYTFRGPIAETEDFELRFRLPQNGIYDLVSELTLTAEGKTFTKRIVKPIRIGVSQLVPKITLEPSAVKAGGAYRLTAEVENVGGESIDAALELTGTLLAEGGVQETVDIRRRDTAELYSKRLFAPSVTKPTPYRFTLRGSYEDERNETLTFFESATLTVEPVPESLRIEAIPDHLTMPRDGTLQVKVFVTNVGKEPLEAEVTDFVRKGLSVVSGKPSAILDLEPGQRKLAYQYALTVLESYRESVLSLKTTANADLPDGSLFTTTAQTDVVFGPAARNTEFDAVPTPAVESADLPSDDSPASDSEGESGSVSVAIPGAPAQKSESFFGKIWHWVRGLFGGAA